MNEPATTPGEAIDPLPVLRAWWREAQDAGVGVPDALVLATVTGDGEPANRAVFLKHLDDGLVFGTSAISPKGRDLAVHPIAAGVLLWPEPLRQVRVTGPVDVLDDDASDALFASHSPASRAGFVASEQSEPTDEAGLAGIRDRVRALADRPGALTRPDPWHGYRLRPTRVEFWSTDPDRAYPRWQYTRPTPASSAWDRRLVQP